LKVAALFLESPSAKGCNIQGCAGVIPALFLFPVPLPTSFGSLSCNSNPFAFSPFCSCAAVEMKLKTLDLWQTTNAESFIWTPEADEALQVAIGAAGFREGEAIPRAKVQEVADLFLKSPSAAGCNMLGCAGVIPALFLFPVPFPTSFGSLSCNPIPFAFSPFCSCAAVETKMKTLGLWQRTNGESFIWTPEANRALQVAIGATGIREGEAIPRGKVQEVAALFLESPSATGFNIQGVAGFLPAFVCNSCTLLSFSCSLVSRRDCSAIATNSPYIYL
jgi:hypothetical protein